MKYKFRIREVDDGKFVAEYKRGLFGGWSSIYGISTYFDTYSVIYNTLDEAIQALWEFKQELEQEEQKKLLNTTKKKFYKEYDYEDFI